MFRLAFYRYSITVILIQRIFNTDVKHRKNIKY